MILVGDTLDIYMIVSIFFVIVGIAYAVYMFFWVNSLSIYLTTQMDLLSRTFEYYYKTENIEPRSINWGIDLVWNPNNEDITGKKGFITVYYGADSGVDTPFDDITEADVVSGEIIKVVDKHLHDKKLRGD